MLPKTALPGWWAMWKARIFWLRITSASGRLVLTEVGSAFGAGARGRERSLDRLFPGAGITMMLV